LLGSCGVKFGNCSAVLGSLRVSRISLGSSTLNGDNPNGSFGWRVLLCFGRIGTLGTNSRLTGSSPANLLMPYTKCLCTCRCGS
jgi:hypothetical protein